MDIPQQVTQYVVTQCLNRGPEFELAADQPLLGHGLLDSLQMLQLVQFIEEQFDVEIDDTELMVDNFSTVNHIVAFVQRKQPPA